MTELADDLEVIVDDTPTPVEDDLLAAEPPEPAKKPEKRVVEPEEGLEVLKRQLADAKANEEAAQTRARTAEQTALKARTEVADTNVQLVTSAIEQVKQSQSLLRSQYAEALAAQDFEKVADLQFEIAETAQKKITLENGLEQLKNAPKPAPAPQNDAVEALAAQLTPKSATWIRAHPDFARNPRLNQRLIAAHNLAESHDIAVDTPEYFAHVEKTLGLSQADELPGERPLSEASEAVSNRAPPAAPPSRNAGGGGSGSRVVRLSAAQRDAAEMCFPEEFAKNPTEAYRLYARNLDTGA